MYVKCSASIGRHELRVVVNVYRGNLAHCAWRLPAGLRHGTVARGSVTVKQGGLHARRVFKLPLR